MAVVPKKFPPDNNRIKRQLMMYMPRDLAQLTIDFAEIIENAIESLLLHGLDTAATEYGEWCIIKSPWKSKCRSGVLYSMSQFGTDMSKKIKYDAVTILRRGSCQIPNVANVEYINILRERICAILI